MQTTVLYECAVCEAVSKRGLRGAYAHMKTLLIVQNEVPIERVSICCFIGLERLNTHQNDSLCKHSRKQSFRSKVKVNS